MSELDKRKKELAEKRLAYKPELLIQEGGNYKAKKSAFTVKVLEEEKQRKEKELIAENERKVLFEKRQKYGKLVKDNYAPKVHKLFLQQILDTVNQ